MAQPSDMRKTPVRKHILPRLIALNDQLCFFLFLENELDRRLLDFGPDVKHAFTPDVFAQNFYASKINVRLNSLQAFQRANRSFTFGAYFCTSYEVASDFFEQAMNLIQETTTSVTKQNNKGGPEDAYLRSLRAAGLPQVDTELIYTMTYCRHRRNAFIHMLDNAPTGYKDLVTRNGAMLNNYWSSSKDELDFSQPNIDSPDESQTISLVKLLRITIQGLDSHLASILDQKGVLRLLAQQLFGSKPVRMNSEVVARRYRSLGKTFRNHYGGLASEFDLDKAVRSIETS